MVEYEKVESEKATEKIYRKLMVTDDMVEYVLEKYGKNWNIEDEIADVILKDLQIKYGKFKQQVLEKGWPSGFVDMIEGSAGVDMNCCSLKTIKECRYTNTWSARVCVIAADFKYTRMYIVGNVYYSRESSSILGFDDKKKVQM
ncbi:hypothetical protein Tco_0984975 [Tanacetum coccineum]